MSCPVNTPATLEAMMAAQEMAMRTIFVLSLIILLVMVVHVAERWELWTLLPKLYRKHKAPNNNNKHRRPCKRPNRKRRGGRAKPPSPVHQQERHAPRQYQECKQYSWEVPGECPPMNARAEEKEPHLHMPDEKAKEWLRDRLASLIGGELNGININ
jgi:hypothetical protein